MPLDIFFRDDVQNALLAANEASASTAEQLQAQDAPAHVTEQMRVYRAGFRAALATVALAFGISPAIIGGLPQQRSVGADSVPSIPARWTEKEESGL